LALKTFSSDSVFYVLFVDSWPMPRVAAGLADVSIS
jgi:hypothetical protein